MRTGSPCLVMGLNRTWLLPSTIRRTLAVADADGLDRALTVTGLPLLTGWWPRGWPPG